MSECEIDGCAKQAQARGWCGTHYMRWKRNGDPNRTPRFERKLCQVNRCRREHYGHGFCYTHWRHWRKHGDPLEVAVGRRPATVSEGEVFGSWTVLGLSHRGARGRRFYWCRCVCGVEKAVVGYSLRNGDSTSCGCLGRTRQIESATMHGHNRVGRRSPTYYTWLKMRERCHDPKHEHFRYYGERGIKVCGRWRDSFDHFLADMGERPEGKTLDRIDPNGNYEPTNCRWATSAEQAANKRRATAQSASSDSDPKNA